MNIAMIGTGYVGLVSGTCFAEMGNRVVCVDIDENKVDQLRNGQLPIYEPDLEHYFSRNTSEGRLTFTTDLAEGVAHAELIFLALPTPPGEDGSADLSYVLNAAGEIADLIANEDDDRYRLIINKSTVPVGTADRVQNVMEEAGLQAGEQFDVV
jgi:UDPglucose 6-dehydrogenase